jgi:hypothetical protein
MGAGLDRSLGRLLGEAEGGGGGGGGGGASARSRSRSRDRSCGGGGEEGEGAGGGRGWGEVAGLNGPGGPRISSRLALRSSGGGGGGGGGGGARGVTPYGAAHRDVSGAASAAAAAAADSGGYGGGGGGGGGGSWGGGGARMVPAKGGALPRDGGAAGAEKGEEEEDDEDEDDEDEDDEDDEEEEEEEEDGGGTLDNIYLGFKTKKPLICLEVRTAEERATALRLTGVSFTPISTAHGNLMGSALMRSESWKDQKSRQNLSFAPLDASLYAAGLRATAAFVRAMKARCAFLYEGKSFCVPHFDKEDDERLFIRLLELLGVHYLMLEPRGGQAVYCVVMRGSCAYTAPRDLFYSTKHAVPSPQDADTSVITVLMTLPRAASLGAKVQEFEGCLAADLPPSACPAKLSPWPTHETSGYKRCMADLTPGQRADGFKKLEYMYLYISASDLRALQIDLAREGGLVGDGYIKAREGMQLVLKKRKFTGAALALLIHLVDDNPSVRTGGSFVKGGA